MLRITAFLIPFLLFPAVTFGQSPSGGDDLGADFVGEQITPRVHYLRQEIGVREAPTGNVAIFEQSDGYVVVDTGSTHRRGEQVADFIESLPGDKPVRAIVITHWHGDHPLGTAGLVARWPDADVISSGRTRAEMVERYGPIYPRLAGSEQLEAYRRQNRETVEIIRARGGGEPLHPDLELSRQRTLYDYDRLYEEREGERLVLPNITFAEKLVLEDDEYPLELLFLGRANTDGDIVVWAPVDRVVATGDIVVAPIPYGFGSYPAEWRATLARIRDLDFVHLIPGHGVAQHDDSYLVRLSALIAEAESQISALLDEGVPEEEIVERLNMARERDAFAGTNLLHRTLFDRYFLVPMVANVVRSRDAETEGEDRAE